MSTLSSVNGTLDQQQFMNLLVTQLQYQDPMDPLSSQDFATQLAQFSTLQGVQQLNTSFSTMLSLQQLTQGANLIGSTVTYSQSGSGGNATAQGTVSQVNVQNGQLQLLINGNSVPLSQVLGVAG